MDEDELWVGSMLIGWREGYKRDIKTKHEKHRVAAVDTSFHFSSLCVIIWLFSVVGWRSTNSMRKIFPQTGCTTYTASINIKHCAGRWAVRLPHITALKHKSSIRVAASDATAAAAAAASIQRWCHHLLSRAVVIKHWRILITSTFVQPHTRTWVVVHL